VEGGTLIDMRRLDRIIEIGEAFEDRRKAFDPGGRLLNE